MTFYVTFGSGQARMVAGDVWVDADGVLEVEAEDASAARAAVVEVLGIYWSDLYSEETMVWHPEGMPEHSYYPRGVVGRIVPTHIEGMAP
jgi:hypothetical protein